MRYLPLQDRMAKRTYRKFQKLAISRLPDWMIYLLRDATALYRQMGGDVTR